MTRAVRFEPRAFRFTGSRCDPVSRTPERPRACDKIGAVKWALLFALAVPAPAAPAEDVFAPLQFLVGDWVGTGGGGPGEGGGEFSFRFDLQNKILVRKSYAEYPAQNGRPASRHDDLTIVYQDSDAKALRAIYFDSENHTIPYSVEAIQGGVRFVSDRVPTEPRYRLIYRQAGDGVVTLDFEIAPPGQPEAFASYIKSRVRRK